MAQVVVFGASNTAGHWDEMGGWVTRLKQKINQMVIASNFSLYHSIYDLSISGNTSREVLAQLRSELELRLDQQEETIIIFSFGGNDSAFNNDTKDNQVPMAEFEKNLKTIVTQAKKVTDKVILIAPTPVDETKVNPIPWFPPYSYLNQEIVRFGDVVKKAAESEKCIFFDFYKDLVDNPETYLTSDGVHLATAGHEFIFQKIWPIVEKLIKETNG